jgi:hypothetical protein
VRCPRRYCVTGSGTAEKGDYLRLGSLARCKIKKKEKWQLSLREEGMEKKDRETDALPAGGGQGKVSKTKWEGVLRSVC